MTFRPSRMKGFLLYVCLSLSVIVFRCLSGRLKSAFVAAEGSEEEEFCEDTSRSGKGLPPSALLLHKREGLRRYDYAH